MGLRHHGEPGMLPLDGGLEGAGQAPRIRADGSGAEQCSSRASPDCPESRGGLDGAGHPLPPVRAAIRAGARGYVLKNEETSRVRAAIKAVAGGTDWLSPRLAYILAADDAPDRPVLSPQETRALRLYATGMPMKSVARRMAISEETAKQYVGRVRDRYARAGRAAPTKIELYYRAVEDGHLPPYPTPRIPPSRL
jgi:Bacterial regulatory proteins, luxR family